MMDEVNLRLPKEARSDSLHGWKMYTVLGRHAEMYPESPKRRHMWGLAISAWALMLGGFLVVVFR
jgi:hypothetical protein